MSPSHPDMHEELSALLDGELSPERARRVAQAVEADPALQAELAQLRAVRGLLGGLAREGAPEGLVESVLERVERDRLLQAAAEPVEQRRPLRWLRRAAGAAVIVLAAGLGLYLYDELSEPPWTARNGHDGPPLAAMEPATERALDSTERVRALRPAPDRDRPGPAMERTYSREPTRGEPPPRADRPAAAPALGWMGMGLLAGPPVREIVVSSADPVLANRQVLDALASQGLAPLTQAVQAAAVETGQAGPDLAPAVAGWFEPQADRQAQRILVVVPVEQLPQIERDVFANAALPSRPAAPLPAPLAELEAGEAALAAPTTRPSSRYGGLTMRGVATVTNPPAHHPPTASARPRGATRPPAYKGAPSGLSGAGAPSPEGPQAFVPLPAPPAPPGGAPAYRFVDIAPRRPVALQAAYPYRPLVSALAQSLAQAVQRHQAQARLASPQPGQLLRQALSHPLANQSAGPMASQRMAQLVITIQPTPADTQPAP